MVLGTFHVSSCSIIQYITIIALYKTSTKKTNGTSVLTNETQNMYDGIDDFPRRPMHLGGILYGSEGLPRSDNHLIHHFI